MMKRKVLLINGPNLNMLGKRQPHIYGHTTLKEIEEAFLLKCREKGLDGISFQSNHEGELIDFIQAHTDAAYILINPGAYTHTSIALRDALSAFNAKTVEIHISNVHAREEFRRHSYIAGIAEAVIAGCGVQGYSLATDYVISKLAAAPKA